MLYEATMQFAIIDDKKGDYKTVKEAILVDNCDTFSEVEGTILEQCHERFQLDVVAIKRSRIKEIANIRKADVDKIFVAEVCDIIDEKELTYKIAFFSPSIDKAKTYIDGYLKQGYGMLLKGLKETKFADVLYSE